MSSGEISNKAGDLVIKAYQLKPGETLQNEFAGLAQAEQIKLYEAMLKIDEGVHKDPTLGGKLPHLKLGPDGMHVDGSTEGFKVDESVLTSNKGPVSKFLEVAFGLGGAYGGGAAAGKPATGTRPAEIHETVFKYKP